MVSNPYTLQVMQQTGMSEAEVNRTCSRPPITQAEAEAKGFASVDEYREALHDFLNGL